LSHVEEVRSALDFGEALGLNGHTKGVIAVRNRRRQEVRSGVVNEPGDDPRSEACVGRINLSVEMSGKLKPRPGDESTGRSDQQDLARLAVGDRLTLPSKAAGMPPRGR
jgi:hypothetical protein